MYIGNKIRKDYLFIVVFITTIIFSSTTLINGFTNVVYGQTNATQVIPSGNVTMNMVNTQDIPLQKVRVGDIDIVYKIFGKGDRVILHNGASDNMDVRDPTLLSGL